MKYFFLNVLAPAIVVGREILSEKGNKSGNFRTAEKIFIKWILI